MFSQGYWAHFGPNGSSPWQFILGEGYQYEVAGENLAKNFMFSDGVVTAWMNSPSHRANMLRESYTDVGYAIVNGTLNGEETTLVVQMFGKPMGTVASASETAKPQALVPSVAVSPVPPPAAPVIATASVPPKINVMPWLFNMNMIFMLFLATAFLLDFYFSRKLGIIRTSGKNLAHFIFVGFICVGLLIITKGKVL